MQKTIALLGSTGSIGRQTLEVAGLLGFRVLALSANRDIRLLEEQTRRFLPAIAAVFDPGCARDFKARVSDLGVKVVSGTEGLIDAASVDGADTVVSAIVGVAGLLPTLAAIGLSRRIALANKETLVCAGELVMKRAREKNAEIIPVDSEHSAIFQCIGAQEHSAVKRLLLTASGGPFRGMSRDALQNVTPLMALRHPNWSMGEKITIDSATMMNKGLEVIEAVHLFSLAPESITVVVHPESIVHSMVEFIDNSIIAQLACPDMRIPIQYALTYPQRLPSPAAGLDISKLSAMTFEEPDTEAFPCLSLAVDTARLRGTACAVLNAANEAAVGLFLDGSLSFPGIYDSVRGALSEFKNIEDPSLEDILSASEEAKRYVIKKAAGG